MRIEVDMKRQIDWQIGEDCKKKVRESNKEMEKIGRRERKSKEQRERKEDLE